MSYFGGKKIPEGATHFWEAQGIFYKKINDDWCFFVRDRWDLSISADSLGFESELTELPTDQPYMPKVGEECEYETSFFTSDKYNSGICTILGYHDDKVWIDIRGNTDFVIRTKVTKFRKPNTEADEMYELVKDAADIYDACEILIKNGYKK